MLSKYSWLSSVGEAALLTNVTGSTYIVITVTKRSMYWWSHLFSLIIKTERDFHHRILHMDFSLSLYKQWTLVQFSVGDNSEHFILNLIKERDPGIAQKRKASSRHINNPLNIISNRFPRLRLML